MQQGPAAEESGSGQPCLIRGHVKGGLTEYEQGFLLSGNDQSQEIDSIGAPCRCQVLAPCCGQVYPCKKCHDQEEDHQLEAQSVQSMVCMACGLRQPSGGAPHKSPVALQTTTSQSCLQVLSGGIWSQSVAGPFMRCLYTQVLSTSLA